MSRSLLRASIEWAVIHLGIGNRNLFDVDLKIFGHLLPRTWIKSLWQFAHKYQLTMPTYEYTLAPRRENVKFLMEEFHQAGFGLKQLVKLNQCRLYLQVKTLSDITEGKGDRISKTPYTGNRANNPVYHNWPQQSKPDKSHWTLWRKALRNSFERTTRQRLGPLANPLGPWIDGKRDCWKWFFNETNSKMYHRIGDGTL